MQFAPAGLPTVGVAADGAKPVRQLKLTLRPGEVRPAILRLERNREARAGDFHAVRIAQTDEKGTTVGGLTLVVRN